MPKKRRKLSKEMEAEMAAAKRKIELNMALIYDIRDEDIQGIDALGIKGAEVKALAAQVIAVIFPVKDVFFL